MIFLYKILGYQIFLINLIEYNDDRRWHMYLYSYINEDELVKKIQPWIDCQHKIFTEITTAVSGDNEKKNYFLLTVLVELEKVTY